MRKNRNKILWSVICVVVSIVCISWFLYAAVFSYDQSETFDGFPVPRFAKIVYDGEEGRKYSWGAASELDGIPYFYNEQIEKHGWKVVERMGATVTYEKDNVKILLTTLEGSLSLYKLNE